jgi:hypothetical protein
MPSFRRRPRSKSPKSESVTASGRYIDLHDRNVVNTLSATKMAWQAAAWDYRDLIGELGAALRLKANIVSKVQFVVAQVSQSEDEPAVITGNAKEDGEAKITVPKHVVDAALDCLSRLPFEQGYKFQGMISQGLDVVGECWLHGFPDDDGFETWEALSTSEVVASPSGLGVIDVPGRPARTIDPDTEALIRLWVPHPQWKQLADSPMRQLLDVCEDVVLTGREIRAAATSRIGANGVLLIPNELSLGNKTEAPDEEPETDAFMAAFTAAVVAPISNEGHAGSIVPIVIRGEAEDLKEVRHVTLQRETSAEVLAKQQAGLDRIANSLDLPPEAMQGVGDANHWTAWLIDASTFKNHIEPSVRMIVDSVTESYFRRTLMLPVSQQGYGLSREDAFSVRIWYEAGNVTENANRSADADTAMGNGAISFKSYRAAKGFDETDAPTEEDLQQLAVINARMDPLTMTQLASLILGTKVIVPPADRIGGVDDTTADPQNVTSLPQRGQQAIPAGPGAVQPGIPQTAPTGARVASAAPAPIVSGDVLADIDRALMERLRTAGDDAITRALEKAGNKIKAKVQGHRDTSLTEQLRGVEPAEVGAMVGYDRLEELGLSEDVLLAAAFAYLSVQFTKWTTAAVKQSVKAAAGLVELPLTVVSSLTQAMLSRIPAAWKVFEESLHKRALDKMYGRAGDELRGEVPDTIVLPADTRAALSEIGGGGHGMALGDDVLRTVDSRAHSLGFTWKYGITPRNRAFEPHLNIAGHRFADFSDPALTPPPGYEWLGAKMRPGDHNGCMCDYVPSWALDSADVHAHELKTNIPPAMADDLYLASLDDAAGRTGTYAQRERDRREHVLSVQEQWLTRSK